MENKKDNIFDLKEFKDKKRIERLDKESRRLGLLDIEGDMGIIRAFLGLPEDASDIETYEAVLNKIEKLKKDR